MRGPRVLPLGITSPMAQGVRKKKNGFDLATFTNQEKSISGESKKSPSGTKRGPIGETAPKRRTTQTGASEDKLSTLYSTVAEKNTLLFFSLGMQNIHPLADGA